MTTNRHSFGLCLAIFGLLAPSLFSAQPAQPTRQAPSARELREEQRIILNAYVKRGEEYLSKSREQLFDNRLKASKENGFHALELLARARAKLDKHPERIEQVRGLFSGSNREELRKNLKENIDPRYFSLQEHLENIAGQLAGKGDSSLQSSLSDAKAGNVDEVVRAIRNQNISVISSDDEGASSSDDSFDSSEGRGSSSNSGSSNSIPLSSGGSVSQESPNSVGFNLPGGSHVSIPGTLSSDGSSVDSPQYGRVDLGSGVKLADGSTAFQTSKGVLVIGADGSQKFIPNAKLNPDGSAKLADGSTVSLSNLRRDPSTGALVTGDNVRINSQGIAEGGGSRAGAGGDVGRTFTGRVPSGVAFVDENGNPVTVDPDWENGEQKGTRRDYLGGRGARLVSETKVTRKIVQSTGNQYTVSVVPGESRTWKLAIGTGETRNVNGSVQVTLTLADGAGLSDFSVKNWEAVSTSGGRATVTPSPGNPNEAVATFTQDGDYEISVTGETGWGSPFRITGKSGIYR